MTPDPVPAARAARLRHGVNLSHWFSQVYSAHGYSSAHLDAYVGTRDFALIRDMGFDHVRFAINCEPVLAAARGGRLPAEWLGRIRARTLELLARDLAVIVDIHPEEPFKLRLAAEPSAVAEFVDFWRRLAAALADLDADRVFFEILNEPCIHDAARWNEIQNAAAAAIRAVAPLHTLILSGDHHSQIPELLKLNPPDDRNIIANFHLYDPIAFTHQGASWSPPWAMFTKGLAYPASPRFIEDFMARVADADARRQLAEYRDIGWSASAYHEFVQPAVAWAREHGLRLTCNEFGVYKEFSPRASRLAWLRDLSSVLSANDIGWTMWDYAGSFAAVVAENGGVRSPDHDLVAALGLRAPAAAS